MTDQELLFFKCSRKGCNRIFGSYVYGNKKYLFNGDIVFYDNILGEIMVYSSSDNNTGKGSYIYPIDSGHSKLCVHCRKGNDLLEY